MACPPCLAGTKRHLRTASRAALSRRGLPEERLISTLSAVPEGNTWARSNTLPCSPMLAAELATPVRGADTTEENLQARIRGLILMAISNRSGSLVLTTGNKSEMGVGYCTLYGDMAGGFAVIKDIAKTFVYRLSRWINREREIIPERIITRPPSAELRPDQTDQDSLPPYEVLDAIMADAF